MCCNLADAKIRGNGRRLKAWSCCGRKFNYNVAAVESKVQYPTQNRASSEQSQANHLPRPTTMSQSLHIPIPTPTIPKIHQFSFSVPLLPLLPVIKLARQRLVRDVDFGNLVGAFFAVRVLVWVAVFERAARRARHTQKERKEMNQSSRTKRYLALGPAQMYLLLQHQPPIRPLQFRSIASRLDS